MEGGRVGQEGGRREGQDSKWQAAGQAHSQQQRQRWCGGCPVGTGEMRQVSEARGLLQAAAQAPGLSSPSVCAYCPRIPQVFEEQKSETGEPLGGSFYRSGSQSLWGDHGQSQPWGWLDGADTQGTMRPRWSFWMFESPRVLWVLGNLGGILSQVTWSWMSERIDLEAKGNEEIRRVKGILKVRYDEVCEKPKPKPRAVTSGHSESLSFPCPAHYRAYCWSLLHVYWMNEHTSVGDRNMEENGTIVGARSQWAVRGMRLVCTGGRGGRGSSRSLQEKCLLIVNMANIFEHRLCMSCWNEEKLKIHVGR